MAAAGHQERLLGHFSVNKRVKYFFCIPTRPANNFYTRGKQHLFE
jgi:hypothetical protein